MGYLDEVFKQTAGEGYFDFARCQRADGSHYGTGGTCRKGDKVGAREVTAAPAEKASRLTQKKIGSLSDEQLKSLIKNPKLLGYQRDRLNQELDKRSSGGIPKPVTTAAPKTARPVDPEVVVKISSNGAITDKKLKEAFDKSLTAIEVAERGRKKLTEEGVDWKDPRTRPVLEKVAKAQESITTIRQAYYAVDRERFLKESAAMKRLELKARDIRREVEAAGEKEGFNAWSLPDNHPLKKRLAEATKIDDERLNVLGPRRAAAYYGEPAAIAKAKADGGGQVDPSVPSRVPRGGASQDLKDFLNGSDVVMAFNPAGFSKFVKEGEAKNGFQQGTGGIKKGKSGYLEGRSSGEEKTMGISKLTEASQRPVYAALEHPDRAKSLQGGEDRQMANYGGIQVVMNPSVKDRATFTIGDSLDFNAPRGIMASPVRDPANPARSGAVESTKVDFNSGGGTSSDRMRTFVPGLDVASTRPVYVETQIHGGLRSSDIQEVRYYKGNDIPVGTRKLLEKQGVKIVELPPQMGALRLYSDNPLYKDITAISPEK